MFSNMIANVKFIVILYAGIFYLLWFFIGKNKEA